MATAKKKTTHSFFLFLVPVFLFFPTACRTVDSQDGPHAFNRPTWWNFYKRGLYFSRNEQWDKAVENFRIAVGDLPGAMYADPEDRRRAKTYGLHFLDDYFPHRELGICYYFQGNYENAEKELLKSRETAPTSRAAEYLNKTKKGLLRSQVNLKAVPPVIQMEFDSEYINEPVYRLSGICKSQYGIEQVNVNGIPCVFGQAKQSMPFSSILTPESGTFELVVKAVDLLGVETVVEKTLFVDYEGPMISLVREDEGTMRIVFEDSSPIETLTVNEQTYNPYNQKEFSVEIDTADAVGLEIEARDRAGNQSLLSLSQQNLMEFSHSFKKSSCMLASTAVHDAELADTAGPNIQMYPLVSGDARIVVTSDTYLLDLLTMDSAGLKSLLVKVNEKELLEESFHNRVGLSRRTCKVPLLPGLNDIFILAVDVNNNSREQSIRVKYLQNALWREDLRMVTSVGSPRIGFSAKLKCMRLEHLLTRRLLEYPRRLNIVERDAEVLEALLREHQLSRSEIAASGMNLRGRIKNPEWTVQSYATQWSGKDNWDFVLNIIDLETGKIVLTTDIHCTSFERSHIAGKMAILSKKLKQSLPAISASEQFDSNQRDLHIGLGVEEQIVEGMRFVFITAEGPEEAYYKDPVCCNGKMVEGVVTSVLSNRCRVKLTTRGAKETLNGTVFAVLR